MPLILRSQVYALVVDHTEVDQELHSLRCPSALCLTFRPAAHADKSCCSQTGQVQAFKLPSTVDDYVYLLQEDYADLIGQAQAAQVPPRSQRPA